MISYLRVIIMTLTAAALLGSGFFFGYRTADKDRAALAAAVEQAKITTRLSDQKENELRQDNAKLSSELALATTRANEQRQSLEKGWQEERSKTQAKVKEFESKLLQQKETVLGLKTLLAKETDPRKIEALKEEIKAALARESQTESQSRGYECLVTPIPDEYVELINEFENNRRNLSGSEDPLHHESGVLPRTRGESE